MASWSEMVGGLHDAAKATFAADSVVYTPAGQPAISDLQAIFRQSGIALDDQVGVAVRIDQPVLDVKLADLPQFPTRQDTVDVNGTSYRVDGVDPDGEGMARLYLKRT